jgi:CHRD domain-containing protein
MSTKTKITLAVSSIIAMMAFAAVSVNGLNNNSAGIPVAFAQQKQKFTAKMTGSEEVPSKNTKATGSADFQLSADGKMMTYKVNVMNIDKVTMAHIHSGKKGVNGPIVVTLFKSKSPSVPMNGILSQGTITSANLEGPLKGY